MSDLTSKTRQRRFTMLTEAPVQFTIETLTGVRVRFKIRNASLSGVALETADALPADESLAVGCIVPATKVTCDGHEHTLGRMIVRSVAQKGDLTQVSLSTVDARIPVDGILGRHLVETIGDGNSPYDFELSSEKFSLADFREGNEQDVDLFAKTKKFSVFLREWEKSDRFGYKNVRTPSMGSRVKLAASRKNGRHDFLLMGSNDYLGLASDPEVIKAAKDAMDDYGFGSTGSPVTSGLSLVHEELSEMLAHLFRKDKVILFNSGYAANLGAISGLIQAQDLVVADMIAHASIQDGMALCQGTARFFKHNNAEHLDALLQENRKDHCGALMITEGVFSMDGDVGALPQLLKVAEKHKCRTMVDEAHSFGVIGPRGFGACEKFEVTDQVDMIMGTFSKVCGGIGGFIAADQDVADWLYILARAHVFSVSIPPSTAAAALKALQIFTRDKSLLERLQANIKHFAAGLRELGFPISLSHESAVLPAVIGDQTKLGIMNRAMLDLGVFVVPIVYPAVSRNKVRFRFTVMATQTISDLDYALNALEQAMKKADFSPHAALAPAVKASA